MISDLKAKLKGAFWGEGEQTLEKHWRNAQRCGAQRNSQRGGGAPSLEMLRIKQDEALST